MLSIINILSKDDIDVFFRITTKCNLSCKICSYSKSYKHKYASLNLTQNIAYHIKKGSRIRLSGGEPCLHPDLEKIVLLFSKIGSVQITTNGFFLDNNLLVKLLEVGLSKIKISIDGVYSQTHDYVRGVVGCWDRVLNNIKMFQKNIKQYKVNISINTVVTKLNFHELVKMPELLNKIGILKWRLLPINLLMVHDNYNELIMSDKDINTFIKYIYNDIISNCSKYGIQINEIFGIPYKRIYDKLNNYNFDLLQTGYCKAKSNQITIDENGFIYICPCCINKSEWCLGYLDEEGIFRSNASIGENQIINPPCINCYCQLR